MENNIKNNVLKYLQKIEYKLVRIDSSIQAMVNMDIYQKELIIQNIQQKLNGISVKYGKSYIAYSDSMRDIDENTKIPACLVLAVLFVLDMFEAQFTREKLKKELSISKAEYEKGKRYKGKYYLIPVPSKGESKNKLIRPGRKNRKRVRSGNYYAYSLQNLIDTLIADIRSGII